jgi:hypothetical protein
MSKYQRLSAERVEQARVVASRQARAPESTPLKRCTGCGQLRELGLFAWKNKAQGTRHPRCKQCQSGLNKLRYEANKPAYIAKAARHNAEYRERDRETVFAFLAAHVCADCGAKPSQADLVPYSGGPSTGLRPVWEVVKFASSEAAVLRALAESVVLCGRCLHLRTAAKNAWASMNHEERDATKWSHQGIRTAAAGDRRGNRS